MKKKDISFVLRGGSMDPEHYTKYHEQAQKMFC